MENYINSKIEQYTKMLINANTVLKVGKKDLIAKYIYKTSNCVVEKVGRYEVIIAFYKKITNNHEKLEFIHRPTVDVSERDFNIAKSAFDFCALNTSLTATTDVQIFYDYVNTANCKTEILEFIFHLERLSFLIEDITPGDLIDYYDRYFTTLSNFDCDFDLADD